MLLLNFLRRRCFASLASKKKEGQMALRLQDKKAIVAECKAVAETASSLIVADYHGVSVGKMTELRKKAREQQVYLKVMRNSLARRAVEGTGFACINPALKGPGIMAFSQEEPGTAAKIIQAFMKENPSFKVRALSVSGKLLEADQLKLVASLPNRQEALSKIAGLLQQPMVRLASALNDVPSQLVRVLAAVRDQKQ